MGSEDVEIKRVMTKKMITINPSASLLEAINLMTSEKISRLIIADNNSAVGVVTKKDIIRYTSSDVSGRTLDIIPISDCMTESLVTENEKARISSVAALMLEFGISSVIITNKSDNLVGIVTKMDIAKFFSDKLSKRFKVKDWMSAPVVTIQPANSIYYAAELMTKKKISRLVVTESSLVGIVTVSDLVAVSPLLVAVADSKDHAFVAGSDYMVPTIMFPHLTVADIMRTNVISIRSDSDVAEASNIMLKRGISGLPVLDNSLELVGILTKTDLCKILAKFNKINS